MLSGYFQDTVHLHLAASNQHTHTHTHTQVWALAYMRELIFNRSSSQRPTFPAHFSTPTPLQEWNPKNPLEKTYLPSFAVFEVDMLPFMWPKEVSSCSTAIADYDETETGRSENPFSLQICAKLSKLYLKWVYRPFNALPPFHSFHSTKRAADWARHQFLAPF